MGDNDAAQNGSGGHPGRTVSFSRPMQSTSVHSDQRLEVSGLTSRQPASLTMRVKDARHRPESMEARLQSGDNAIDDETTGIISRGSGQSYLATQGSTRSHRSIYRRRAAADDQPSPAEPDSGAGSGGDVTDAPTHSPWWKAALGSFQSIELDNKGSVARDHLSLGKRLAA